LADETLTLADLRQQKRNARKHTPRNIGMIVGALQEVGAARSGVIDENNTILAGNGTYEALAEAGIERVRVVETDGNEWVVVRRRGLSEKLKERLALYDNRASDTSTFDAEVLAGLLLEDDKALDGLFTADEINVLMRDLAKQEYDFIGNMGGEDAPEQEATERQAFPLAIVLTKSEYARWCEFKTTRKLKDDKAALLALIGE
jgi:hypothetical protein